MTIDTYSPYARSYHPGTQTRKVTYGMGEGRVVLYYSYDTVIGFIDGDAGFMTSRRYSVTTSKHQGFAAGNIYRETSHDATSMADPEFRNALEASLQRHGLDTSPAFSGWVR